MDGSNHIPPSEGNTRICLDPWNKVFIRSNGDVCMCCNSFPIGSLSDSDLESILNNERIIAYRKGLLTGDLMPECRTCPDRESGPITVQINLVKEWKND